jgi:hypothetical protein
MLTSPLRAYRVASTAGYPGLASAIDIACTLGTPRTMVDGLAIRF